MSFSDHAASNRNNRRLQKSLGSKSFKDWSSPELDEVYLSPDPLSPQDKARLEKVETQKTQSTYLFIALLLMAALGVLYYVILVNHH